MPVVVVVGWWHFSSHASMLVQAGNILLNKKGQVKLADFGISAFLDADETRRRTQIGSPFWMSPELILGEGYSYKTDIWSLGITILEMTEVEHTFFEQNPLTVCHTSTTLSLVSQELRRLTRCGTKHNVCCLLRLCSKS